jgi:hypothetical protein
MASPPISKDSADWRPLKSWLRTQIFKEQTGWRASRPVPEASHNISRGRIAAFRSLIQAVEPEVLLEKDAVESEALDGRVDY